MNYLAVELTRYLWNSVSDAKQSFGELTPKRLEYSIIVKKHKVTGF